MKNDNLLTSLIGITLSTPLVLSYFIPQLRIIAFVIGLIASTGFITAPTKKMKIISFLQGSCLMCSYFIDAFLLYNLIFGSMIIFLSLILPFTKDSKSKDETPKIMYADDGDTLKTIIALGTIRRAHKDPEILFIFDNIVTLEVSCKNKVCSLNLTDSAQSTDIGSLNETVFRVKNFILACLESYKLIDEHDLISKLGDKK